MAKQYSLVDDVPRFKKLNDQINQMNTNITQLQGLHESFTQFNESVGALIYGLNINAWCTEFSEAPNDEVFIMKKQADKLLEKTRVVENKIAQLKNESRVADQPKSSQESKPGKITKPRRQSRIPHLSSPVPRIRKPRK